MIEQPFGANLLSLPDAEKEEWKRVKSLYIQQNIHLYADESMHNAEDVALLKVRQLSLFSSSFFGL